MSHGNTNLLSPDFDADLALSAEQVRMPFPDIKPLDNIAACTKLLPAAARPDNWKERPTGPRRKPEAGQSASGDVDAAGGGQEGSQPGSSSASRLSLSAQWRASFADGPLRQLREMRRQRVRVVVRRQYGLRGCVEGKLELFDRHWNMVLTRARERWVQLEWADDADDGAAGEGASAAAAHGSSSSDSAAAEKGGGAAGWSSEDAAADESGSAGAPPTVARWRVRAMPQLLLRGDCVVSVSRAGAAGGAAPAEAEEEAARDRSFRLLAAAAARRLLLKDAAAAGEGGWGSVVVWRESVPEEEEEGEGFEWDRDDDEWGEEGGGEGGEEEGDDDEGEDDGGWADGLSSDAGRGWGGCRPSGEASRSVPLPPPQSSAQLPGLREVAATGVPRCGGPGAHRHHAATSSAQPLQYSHAPSVGGPGALPGTAWGAAGGAAQEASIPAAGPAHAHGAHARTVIPGAVLVEDVSDSSESE